jgi:mono/diheme cytochrome c family protein
MSLSRLPLVIFTIALFTVGCIKTEPGPITTVTPTASPAVSPGASATPDEFAAARLNYARHCVACHGAKGEGGTAEVEGKKIKAPPLATGHALSHSDPDFVKQINKGGDGMPAFADKISAKDVDDLVRFIRHELQGGAKSTAMSGAKGPATPPAMKQVAPVVK